MRHIHDDPELAAAVDRYVRPGGRYLKLLHGNFLRLAEPERTHFVQALTSAARQATTRELTVLLEGEWRARLTGSVLAGLTRRWALRDRIGSLLLASELVYAGQGYCYALASFGGPEDAALLTSYLDRYLPQTQLRYDQPWALGALLHVDNKLGTRHAVRFLAADGPWQQWAEVGHGATADPLEYRGLIDGMCALTVDVDEAGRVHSGRGRRRR
jgi:hypothetical protein